MKISYNWLKEHLEFDLPVEKVSEILTDTGLEVEAVEKFESFPGGLEGLVVGEVLEKSQHPNADRLSTTVVNIGSGDPLPIVCGAPNVEAGQKVIVATVGTTLYPTGGEAFKIKKSKIRGEVSEGMICAEDEIGMGISHDGIMVLDSDAKVGTPAAEIFELKEDYTIEIGLTPNRTDAMSHRGVARDLLAAMKVQGLADEKQELKAIEVPAIQTASEKVKIEVVVEAPEAAPRYAGVCLSGIEVEESPDWLKNRLRAIGQNPINNVVDITNYVLHDLGQPLHAFDYDQIMGQKVVVRLAKEGEGFTTLDEKDRKLDSKDLMICDASDAMCMAGVFGGLSSGVTESTKRIFLESACFDPVFIRKTAKRHGLSTDASYRFERGVDANGVLDGLNLATGLMCLEANAEKASEVVDLYPKKVVPHEHDFNYGYLDQLVGIQIPRKTVKNILTWLGFEIAMENERQLHLKIPTYRVEVTRKADVVEEVLRIYGYNQVDIPEKLSSNLNTSHHIDSEELLNQLCNALVARGYTEMMSNSLTKSSHYEGDATWTKEELVPMKNPLSSDLDVMRQTLLFQGLEVIQHNVNHRRTQIKFFEYGNTYRKRYGDFVEQHYLDLFMSGPFDAENWNSAGRDSDVFLLKNDLEVLIQKAGGDLSQLEIENVDRPYLKTGIHYVYKHKWVAEVGIVSDEYKKRFELDTDVFYGSLHWTHLLEMHADLVLSVQDIPKQQAMRRDLALLVDEGTEFVNIETIARSTEKKLLQKVGLFDVYEGKNLPAGKKSYAISFEFLDPQKTLVDKQVDKVMKKIYNRLKQELGAELRSGEL